MRVNEPGGSPERNGQFVAERCVGNLQRARDTGHAVADLNHIRSAVLEIRQKITERVEILSRTYGRSHALFNTPQAQVIPATRGLFDPSDRAALLHF